MNRFIFLIVAALIALSCMTWSRCARAAESYANCTGFITSIPAVINTQGTWCLKQNLSTAISNGTAVTISTNNVTIDCNGYTLSGSAGAATLTGGIYAADKVNATVRHCTIQGFYSGVFFTGSSGGGHLVEDNRFDSNAVYGPNVQGDGSVIRRNLVYNTGPSTNTAFAYGILGIDSVDILDNTVHGVTTAPGSNGYLFGIKVFNDADGRISGNRVRGLAPDGTGFATAIAAASSANVTIRGNDLVGSGAQGVACEISSNDLARDNIILGFTTANAFCGDDGSNYSAP
jgi:anti-anti-sigma regulatory factor